MAGRVPAIHVLLAEVCRKKDVDVRDERGHDRRDDSISSERGL